MQSINEDLIYEISQHLDFHTLQKLCSTDKSVSQICQQFRFQTLIQNKYIDYHLLQNNAITYEIQSSNSKTHSIKFSRSQITEISGFNDAKSILFELFPSNKIINMNRGVYTIINGFIFRVSRVTQEEIKNVLSWLITNTLFNPAKIKIV